MSGALGKLLKVVGVEAEEAPTEKQEEINKKEQKMILAWRWLRDQIDKDVDRYLRTGDRSELEKRIGSPAIDAMLPYLDDLRQKGVLWSRGSDVVRKESQVEVVSAELNKQKQPTSFIVRERFRDQSVISGPGGQKNVCPGTERVLQARVDVIDGQDYKLLNVIQLRGEAL